MHDTLLSRFRGAYLGAALGEQIGTQAAVAGGDTPTGAGSTSLVQLPRWVKQPFCNPKLNQPAFWTDQILAQTSMLLDGKQGVVQPQSAAVPQPPVSRPPVSQPTVKASKARTEFMARLLPLALQHHDQPQVLQHHIAQSWHEHQAAFDALQADALSPDPPPDTRPDTRSDASTFDSPDFWAALILGQTISLILRERFRPPTLIPQVLRDLDLPDLPAVAPVLSQLTAIQTWLTQSADLATVARRLRTVQATGGQATGGEDAKAPELLGSGGLAVVLYSFLSSTADPEAMLLRFARLQAALSCSPALTGTILGSLAGLYGGLPSLPFEWRQTYRAEQSPPSDQPETLTEAVLFHQADRLLAHWSGVCPTADWWSRHPHVGITAPPRVIQLE